MFTTIAGHHPSDSVNAVFLYYREALFAQIIMVSRLHMSLMKDYFGASTKYRVAEPRFTA